MRKLLTSLFILSMLPAVGMAASSLNYPLATEAGLTYSTTYFVNLNAIGNPQTSVGKVSAQVVWSSVAYVNSTFTDGVASTSSLTVVSTAPLVGKSATNVITVPSTSAILGTPATNQITVISTTGLAGVPASFTTVLTNFTGIAASSPSLIINGQLFYVWAGNWASTDTIQHAATTLASAINAGGTYTASVVNSTGVTISLISSGTFANGFTVNSSSFTDISTGTFSGGTNPVSIAINNTAQTLTYTYGGNWTSSDTINHAATTLASAINSTGNSDLVAAAPGSNVVYASATLIGPVGNNFTITTSSAAVVSVSSSSFLNGKSPALLSAFFTVAGKSYQNGLQWSDVSGTSTGTAASITAFINSVGTTSAVSGGGLGNIVATASGDTINLVTVTSGTANNGVTLTASPASGGLTIASATFIGGQDNAGITINGTTLTLGIDFAPPLAASTTANLATSIATAINANTALSAIIRAATAGSVVTSTANSVGSVTNYTTVSSTQSQLSFSSSTMTGGTTAAYTLNSAVISVPGHKFTKALPVLYSGSPAIGGLATGTTYFIILVDSNSIKLALTSTGAVAGLAITLTSSSTQTTADTYTLAPLAYSQGAASGKWIVSNDGVHYNDFTTTSSNISVSSQTFAAVNPSTGTVQDFGFVDYQYLGYKAIGPTQGGISLSVILNTKD